MKTRRIIIDEQSFRYYYDLYFNDLCKSLNYYTRNLEVIEDTVQDVFVSLWENRTNVDISYIQTYLFTSVRNRMFNVIRDNRNRIMPLEPYHAEAITIDTNESFDEELFQTTEEAINSLPGKCKEIFLLNKQSNLTYKQIAEAKHISVKTVENQIGIALKKIRSYVRQKAILSVLTVLFFITV